MSSKVPRFSTGTYIRWRLVKPLKEESCRWECVDRRWVSLSIGRAAEAGKVVVEDNAGKRELADSYDSALALAKTWRT